MSPRSEDFFRGAQRRLAAARNSLAAGDVDVAVSVAYYASLYAARAALSEDDRYAKTHGGTWGLFHQAYVRPERFDPDLFAVAAGRQRQRQAVDYEALEPADAEAAEAVAVAERFVAAVGALLA